MRHSTDLNNRLILAVKKFDLESVERLFDAGANPNTLDSWNNPIVKAACEEPNGFSILKLFVDRGMNIEIKTTDGKSMLSVAASNRLPEIVRFLISKGADVNARDARNKTPLHHVYGVEAANILIEAGADIGAVDDRKNTPLHAMVWDVCADVADTLLMNGASHQATNFIGMTPLHWAAYYNGAEVIKVLLSHYADINATARHGKTALHIAMDRRSVDAISILLDSGVDTEMKDDSGYVARDFIEDSELKELERTLSVYKRLKEINQKNDVL